MAKNNDSGDEGSGLTDDLTFSRRTALALLGAGGAAAAMSGSANAAPGYQGDTDREERWDYDVDGQGHDMRDMGRIWADAVVDAARKADVVVWKDDSGDWGAASADEHVGWYDDPVAALNGAIGSLSDGRSQKARVALMSPGEGAGTITVPDNTVLDIPVPLTITDGSDVLWIPGSNTEFPNVNLHGQMGYGVVMGGDAENVKFGDVTVMMDPDNRGNAAVRVSGTNVEIENLNVAHSGWGGLWPQGVDNLQVGSVTVRDSASEGIFMRDSTDVTIDQVYVDGTEKQGIYMSGNTNVSIDSGTVKNTTDAGVNSDGNDNVNISLDSVEGTDFAGILLYNTSNASVTDGVVKATNGPGIRIDSGSGGMPTDARSAANAEGNLVQGMQVYDHRDEPGMTVGIEEIGDTTARSRIVDNDVRGSGTDAAMTVTSPSSTVRDNTGGGVASGRVTLSGGSSEAARVAGVSENGGASLRARSHVATSAPDSAMAYDTHFEWNGSEWHLVFTWVTDPGSDVPVDYIVDQVQAEGYGYSKPEMDPLPPGMSDGTYRISAEFHTGDVNDVGLVAASASAGAAINTARFGNTDDSLELFEVTFDKNEGWAKIALASNTDLVMAAAGGGTETSTNVVLESDSGADHQKWELTQRSEGYYDLAPMHTDNREANVWENESGPGAEVRLWEVTADANANFRFIPESEGAPSAE